MAVALDSEVIIMSRRGWANTALNAQLTGGSCTIFVRVKAETRPRRWSIRRRQFNPATWRSQKAFANRRPSVLLTHSARAFLFQLFDQLLCLARQLLRNQNVDDNVKIPSGSAAIQSWQATPTLCEHGSRLRARVNLDFYR